MESYTLIYSYNQQKGNTKQIKQMDQFLPRA